MSTDCSEHMLSCQKACSKRAIYFHPISERSGVAHGLCCLYFGNNGHVIMSDANAPTNPVNINFRLSWNPEAFASGFQESWELNVYCENVHSYRKTHLHWKRIHLSISDLYSFLDNNITSIISALSYYEKKRSLNIQNYYCYRKIALIPKKR